MKDGRQGVEGAVEMMFVLWPRSGFCLTEHVTFHTILNTP